MESAGSPRHALRGIVSPRQDNAEELRRNHLSYEAYVKGLGVAYIANGCLFGISGCSVAFDRDTLRRHLDPLYGVLVLIFGLTLIWTGFGLRKLRPWARILPAIISGTALLAFPAGTLVGGSILYLLFSKKGSMVFSDLYRRAIAATPYMKYRTPIILWILLGLVILLFVVGVFYAAFSGFRRR